MKRYLYLDIETIPGQTAIARAALEAEAATEKAAVRAPSNYKDALKIEEFIAARHVEIDAAFDEKWRRTSFDGAFGQIVAVGLALDAGEPVCVYEENWDAPGAEGKVLLQLNAVLETSLPPADLLSTTIVGHYVSGFDLRFLAQRFMVLGIQPHPVLARAARAKPWDDEIVFDTMVQWAGARDSVKLEKLCTVFGIEGKGDMDGSKVWDCVRDGQIDAVADYCAADVQRVRAVHRRMTFASVAAA